MRVRFDQRIKADLENLERRDLLRTPRAFAHPGPTAIIDGREVVCLTSNDYLGFATDPRLREAVRGAANTASGAGASRLVTGTLDAHRDAERALSVFLGLPATLLFSSGYAANVGVIQALAGPGDLVLSDALNHASIIDGCRLSRARVAVYRHRDMEHLGQLLASERPGAQRALIISETVFSMDGDTADVRALRAVANANDAGLVLDEAHALGTLGPGGRGLAASHGIQADALVGTLGKAFGLMGAFVGGSGDLVRLLTNRARSFVFSTATTPAVAGAIPCATDLVAGADDRRLRLRGYADRLRKTLGDIGYAVPDAQSCIVPVLLGEPRRALEIAAALLEHGLYVHPIRPPTVPVGTSRLRLAPSAAHEDAHLEQACDAIRLVLG
jgi:8-amino-7-oxononanoate synthase